MLISSLPSKRAWLFLGIGLTFIGVWAWQSHAATNTPDQLSPQPTAIHAITIASETFQPTESYTGLVHGQQQATVTAKASGYIVSLLKEPGDRVRAGELLAVLDGNELIAGSQSAALSLDASRNTLDQTTAYFRQKVREAEANLSKVKVDQDNGNATNKDVRVAKEALQSATKFRDLQDSQAQAGIAAAQGSTLVATAALQSRFIKAPFAGIIIAKSTSLGTFVNSGASLYEIASPDALEINVSVPARLADFIHQGTLVSITPEHSGQSIDGVVFSVTQAANPATGEIPVRIRLMTNTSHQSLSVGQYATVTFLAAKPHTSLLIPSTALLRSYGDTFVFIVKDGTARRVLVTLGQAAGDRQEILSGLTPGDQLITEGLHTLRTDMPITLITEH
ncbi:MAG: efflux RND transporter periplasmic adaptor subunit [Candidatus Moraniibacteriota bacterium]